MKKDGNAKLLLRVTVEAGGCHGFQYLMSLVDEASISGEDDTVFAWQDHESESKGTRESDAPTSRVVMDEASLGLLRGSTVDYSVELIGSQFRISGNPAASSSCGCGTSFDVKV